MKYLITFLTISLYLNSCVREKCQIAGSYEFELPVTLTPAKDTFHIGDTITVVSSFPDEVYERKTEKTYKLENFRFYPELIISELSDSVADRAALLNFEIIIDDATNFYRIDYNDGAIDYIGEYSYAANSYDLEYKLVPKVSGFYIFGHASTLIGIGLGSDQDFDGKCSNISVSAAMKLNGGADNNIEMLKYSPDPHYNDWILQKPEDRFYKFGGYCFYVRE
jgi:hypothetical protein